MLECRRLLVSRGVRIDKLWHAAALGLLTRLAELAEEKSESAELSKAFWHACAGGQRRAAEYLLVRGADLNWVPDYAEGTPLDAAHGLATRQEKMWSPGSVNKGRAQPSRDRTNA